MRQPIERSESNLKPLRNYFPEPTLEEKKSGYGKVAVTPSQLAQKVIILRDAGGLPFTLNRRPYLLPIYDSWHRKLLIMGGRQIEKSSTLSNLMLMPAIAEQGFRSLLVSPTDTHTRTFAYDKLDGTLIASPLLTKILGKPRVDNLYHKEFKNKSSILLRSAYLTARSARGIPADQLLVDESQEMIPDHLPVLAETLTHSHLDTFGRRIVLAGTANTPQCMLGEYWDKYSTQGEWVIKCPLDHPNIILIDNLSVSGLICTHKDPQGNICGKHLNPINGKWEHMRPERKRDGLYVGYRIPQVINPMVFDHWDDVKIKILTYSNAKLHQEVLGISYEVGSRPINFSQLLRCENKNVPMSKALEYIEVPIMGVDWGYGDVSYSVVHIGGWNQRNNFQYIFAKKFKLGEEIDPEYQLQYILQLVSVFRVQLVGLDYGAGWGQNARLKQRLGDRALEFIYSHGQKEKLKWSKKARRYSVNRTETMTDLFEAFKVGRIETFLGYTEEFGQDFLNVTTTQDKLGKILYQHAPSAPDDSVHSASYALMLGRIMRKELRPLIEEEPSVL